MGVEVAENASDTLLERNHFAKNRLAVRFAAAGRNTVVDNNEFVDDKDAGLWAVRSALRRRTIPITVHDNKFTEDGNAIVAGNVPVLDRAQRFFNSHEAAVHIVGAGAVMRGNRINGGAAMGIVVENARGAVIENNEIEGVDGVRRHGARLVEHAGAGQPLAQLRLWTRLRPRRPEEREPCGRERHHRAEVQRDRRRRRFAQLEPQPGAAPACVRAARR